ncbi:glutamine amidotransferase-related protein, partial [Pradoshia sp.]
ECFEQTAVSEDDQEIMGIQHKEYPLYGVQFHPESIGTPIGKKLLMNFLSLNQKERVIYA